MVDDAPASEPDAGEIVEVRPGKWDRSHGIN